MSMTKKNNIRIYISGAIEHHDICERKLAFMEAENKINSMGMVPVNPFKNGLDEGAHWREHMRKDIQMLLECDYIYLLDGWEQSKGAKLEFDVASSCGLKVLYEEKRDIINIQ